MSTALAAARAKTKGKRMLREALEGYGEDEYTLSEWNAIKQQAERDGEWRWKASDTNATLATVKDRVQKDAKQELLDQKFATDLDSVMAAELHPQGKHDDATPDVADPNQCAWRERIGGKQFGCTNDLPLEKGKNTSRVAVAAFDAGQQPNQQLCRWHVRECVYGDHPMEKSRAIEIPNDQGYCLHCYEATALKERGTLQKTPLRVPLIKVPGVCEVNLKRNVQRESLLKGGRRRKKDVDGDGLSRRLTSKSVCAWEKEHTESAFIWQCRNFVVMHPTLRGAFLPFCGYHAPRCIQEYGGIRKKSAACPSIERRNPFGMCRNHVEAHLSTLSFEARAKCIFADSDFDVPGIIECRRDRLNPKPKRHPLAPKEPPPSSDPILDLDAAVDRFVVVKAQMNPTRWDGLHRQWDAAQLAVSLVIKSTLGYAITGLLNHSNPLSALLKKAIWRFQFLRRGDAVATRVQRIFRGNRARRRVRAMGFEQAALKRMRACVKIQRIARGFLGRLAFAHEAEAVAIAVPNIQRIVRGGLARLRSRRLRAALCLQRNFRAYRQRCFAWALREEIEYMRALQRQADANYQEMLVQLEAFRRVRARRVLRAHVARWRQRKEEKARLAYERLQALLSAVKIQRAYRRYQYYKRLKMRYLSAQQIQKRVRGWLTRHMWKDDPGLLWITSFIRPESGFEYGKVVVLAQPSGSYAYPSRRIRMQYAALAIQRVYRGFMGRLAANMRWVAMLKRWEWLSLDSTGESTDSMTLGHQRYGFLLPSHNYHHEKRRHMLSIKRGIKADRGFAYKYQNILELIEDRDGKRAWNLAKEEQWKRDREKVTTQSKKKDPADARGKKIRHETGEVVDEKAVAIAQAIYPVGCLVLVASTNRRDRQRYHKARVTAVHSDPTRASNASTIDVEYISSFLSVRGVRMYNEPRVPLTRLRPVGRMTQEEELNRRSRRSVGKLIESTIQQLKLEIEASRQKRLGKSVVTPVDDANTEAFRTVDELADCLRDEDPSTDLLIDQRDFVNFVFQNSTLLRTKWLQVIDHIRHGTRDKETRSLLPSRPQSSLPRSPSFISFYREFGFDAVKNTPHISQMPDRAVEIEWRMTELGFLHDPSANVKGEPSRKTKPAAERPRTTPSPGDDPKKNSTVKTLARDDLAIAALAAATPSSAQDLHRLIYELKTLPRERHREKIIEVATRHARSFICGLSACGRCFSSHEAARLHQEGVHLHQRRLATATPMTDQYLHAFWPPSSPWNQEHNRSFAPSVGYYRCSRVECEGRDGQFRTRRELQRHLSHVHGVQSITQTDPKDDKQATEKIISTTAEAAISLQIWLGTYVLCRNNLEKKIDPFPPTASWHGSDAVQCEVHHLSQADPERCRECFARSRRLILPCRLYKSVALPGSRGQRPLQQQDDKESLNVDGYVIFSVEDPLLCPVVREHDLISLDEDDKDRKKRLARQHSRRKVNSYESQAAASTLVALRLLALCRDTNGVSWAIGQVYKSVPLPPPTRSESASTPEIVDSYEVTLDEAHVVAAVLEDVRAVCIVHRCTKTEFLRKHFCRDDPVEMRKLGEPRVETDASPRRIRVTLERFCRDRIVHEESDGV